jgi:signal transduction histidine kinase
MTRKRSFSRGILLSLFVAAVLFGSGVIYKLGDAVENIQTAEQSDPLWIASQLRFELLRLEKDLALAASNAKTSHDPALRFDIAWSRINVLQEGRLPQLLKRFALDPSVLFDLEATFEAIEPQIAGLSRPDISEDMRRQAATDALDALAGFDASLRTFLLALAQAETNANAKFRIGLLSLSHAIAYLSVTIVALFGIFVASLWIELRTAKRTENEMRLLAQEATSASRMKTNFMSVVSHELRTPLTSILGGLSLLKMKLRDTAIDAATLNLLNVASRNGDRLLTLVNDILDAQALSEGKVSVERKPVDLNSTVATAVENCQAYADKLGVRYQTHISGAKMMALTDHDRVTQVLVNLISNATKFTSSGDVVEISITRRNQLARIEVTDHGIGIPCAQQGFIFAPFHQINPGTTGANKSSGLGLSITKQLMDLLGGEIAFRSTEGRGSTFWIELELLPEHRERIVPQLAPAQLVPAT